MFTFTILLLPLAVAFYYFNSEKKHSLLSICIGIITGFLVLAVKEFFTNSHRIIPYSYSSNFIFLLFAETFIPVVVLFGIYFLISKDSLEFKFGEFFPLTASFYIVYLPYLVISSPEAKTAFEIFAKPVLFLSMLVSLQTGLNLILKGIKSKKFFIPAGVFLILLYLVIPALMEALFFTAVNPWLYGLLTGLSALISAGLALLPVILPKILQKKDLTE